MPYRLRFSRLLRKFVGEDALRVADALHEPAEEQGGLFVNGALPARSREESWLRRMAAEAETLRLSTKPHIGMRMNPSAAALTSSLIPACSVPNMSTKGLCDTSNASGEVSPLWGVVAMSR